jgi:hypothetical protein
MNTNKAPSSPPRTFSVNYGARAPATPPRTFGVSYTPSSFSMPPAVRAPPRLGNNNSFVPSISTRNRERMDPNLLETRELAGSNPNGSYWWEEKGRIHHYNRQGRLVRVEDRKRKRKATRKATRKASRRRQTRRR